MKTTEIRERFLKYFEDNGHQRVPSSPLVPQNDPTLLFTNAGMVQFKDVFLGLDKRPYSRATTSQRCVRAGGKHNDLENVGYTARHHTFFEMLGNFSFGEYFKREAIRFAWDFLTEQVNLPVEKLWVTVYEDDDEAADIWLNEIGVDPGRFGRIGAHANFWAMGDTGPCGPCSEIFYDHGREVEGGPPGSPDEDGDRYVEIWNLVFMQFNRDEGGNMSPLPKPSVDTGMGLERLAAVLQGVHSNYDIDLFRNLIDAAQQITGARDREDKSLRVLADHIRSTAFLIVDGVVPANEGRGYVLRRIIRRAIRHGYGLGGQTPFFHKMVAPLVAEMGAAYPELVQAKSRVTSTLREEEERFAETLEQGMRIFEQEIGKVAGSEIPGELAFRLYDTYGFPIDLTADVGRERGLEVDMAGFERAMEGQRAQARAASRFKTGSLIDPALLSGSETVFTGYETTSGGASVTAISRDGSVVDSIGPDDEAIIVLNQSPFYAESGGQVGDAGLLQAGDAVFEVRDTQKLGNGVIGHFGRLISGKNLVVNDQVTTEVESPTRERTMRNHSATHLLHAALKAVLGRHVEQKGSLVKADRLRFDFSHPNPVTDAELAEIEDLINQQIRANNPVETRAMALEEAKKAGAEALFGEKYDDEVRVVQMGEFSLELCGGTHVSRTGDIGPFFIVSEAGIAAGVRRIEAVTGIGAVQYVRNQLRILDEVAGLVKATRGDVGARVEQLLNRVKQLEKDRTRLQRQLAAGGGQDLAEQAEEVLGIKVLAARLDGADTKTIRNTIDRLRDQLGESVVVLGSRNGDKSKLIAGVSRGVTAKVHAGKLINDLVSLAGGRGGGRPDMAEGGVPEDQIESCLARVADKVRAHISGS
jgi:alanyl-tRNA synthetase